MSYADYAMREYYDRTKRSGPMELDAWYQYQTEMLRNLLTRLEVILEDEGVAKHIINRVIKDMIYGSPDPADAIIRQHLQTELMTMKMQAPPVSLYPARERI